MQSLFLIIYAIGTLAYTFTNEPNNFQSIFPPCRQWGSNLIRQAARSDLFQTCVFQPFIQEESGTIPSEIHQAQ